ncbi:MAG: NusA-like transcription termination signal-binding factor [Candidatus Altiarchaeales archaeon]|nr:MAG: NusA-like transcription termination signal-binding factor [Candidatus Altiarchaeales archaeon]HDI73187.1 NusA-like transcription termination signal-binding factor [Candidatus Altiarchaeales archaeon]
MGKIRLKPDEIKYITLFETLTGATIKDCIQEEGVMGFLVKKGDMGLAIGKNGSNIERVKKVIGKGIWITEFSDDLNEFVKNLFQPIKIKHIRIHDTDNEKIVILEINKRDRKMVIGHNGNRIKIAKKLVKRHFAIDDIKIKTTY